MHALFARLYRIAETIAAGLLAVIFVAFILQIALRYVFNWPVGWTAEVSVVAWLWLVLFGAAFVLRDAEELRIDFLYAQVGRRVRLVMSVLGSVAMAGLMALSLPASYAYVSFMKVEKSAYLKMPFDVMFSIYLVFAVAVIVRHGWTVVQALRGRDPLGETTETVKSTL